MCFCEVQTYVLAKTIAKMPSIHILTSSKKSNLTSITQAHPKRTKSNLHALYSIYPNLTEGGLKIAFSE